MTIRKHLLTPNVDKEKIDYLQSLIEEIESKIDNQNVDDLIANFQQEINDTAFDKSYFESFHSFESSSEFALKAYILPQTKVIKDITREELIWLVEQIRNPKNFDYHDYYLELVKKNVPFPEFSNLIYWPSEYNLDDNLSSEKIVDLAMQYNSVEQLKISEANNF